MPILFSDGGKVDSCRLGDVALDAVYLGDDKMWPTFTARGMSKSGNQTLANWGAWVKITGWTPDVGSTVVDDSLLLPEEGPCIVSAVVAWASNPANRQCRVTRNGVAAEVATSPVGTSSVSFSLTVAAGDVLTLEAMSSSTLSTNRRVAAAGTFLRVVPA